MNKVNKILDEQITSSLMNIASQFIDEETPCCYFFSKSL